MQQRLLVFLIPLICAFFSACQPAQRAETDTSYQHEIDSLLSIMTLEEKVGQMLNLGLPALLEGDFYSYRDTLIFDSAKIKKLLVTYGAGSVQNLGNYPLTPQEWNKYIGYIQDVVKAETRLKIPVLYGIDAIHGANYTVGSVMFPQQINLAASFDTENAARVGAVTAYEVRASFTPWNYAPVLDVARNPLWGRTFETFGEDPYLVGEMGQAMMESMQGDMPLQYDKVLACGKHFLAYGAPYNGKDRSLSIQSEQSLREIHLPPFQKAIDAGLLSVMVSAGVINRLPTHIDQSLITGILKEELGFKGVVIGDWDELGNLYNLHRIAEDEREAVKKMVMAGIDMCMEPYDESFAVHLIDLVNSGEVPMDRINDAVHRILYLKFVAGLFDDPTYENYHYPDFSSKASHELNLQIAEESIVLLKNEKEVLPLDNTPKVLVTGVAAHSINYLNGGWSRTWSGEGTDYNDTDKLTILDALKGELGEKNVLYAQGTDYLADVNTAKSVALARQADIIIACIGEKPATEKPSDIENLDLPDVQVALVKQLAALGKPVILVIAGGRPRIIREIEPLADGIIMAFLPGNEGGRAIANILTGKANPSAKLPYTWPRYSGSIFPYDHSLADERGPDFQLGGFNPQFEFGHGLSYTHFQYDTLVLSKDTLAAGDSLTVEISITNKGEFTGKEPVLLFVSDEVASLSPPVKKLRKFSKIELDPGETQKLNFILSVDDLSFVGQNNSWIYEPGYFTVMAGNKEARFYLSTK